jgi:uncharacterized circularly permuted ATP-grasp superfamily protein
MPDQATSTSLLEGYDPSAFFDEMFDGDGAVRPHYRDMVELLAALDGHDLDRRQTQRDRIFRTLGITFNVYGDDEGAERTFPLDLLPRIIPADEWATVERGLVQRVTALNLFLDDLYAGERACLHDEVVPAWLVQSSDGFVREAAGISVPYGARCTVAGIDVVRGADGAYVVLEDNVRNPSGVSYVVENRATMTRLFPTLFERYRVRPVDHYPHLLREALHAIAPPGAGTPRAAILTPGAFNSAYFEHAFLARQMGVELVEGRDLVVDDHTLYMRSTQGLERVDVLYRRIDDRFLDPVEFRPDSLLGVPGLLSAVRAGTVTLANAVGNGVADDKAVYPFVPDLVRYYLGEEPILHSVPTYLLWEPDQRAQVMDRLDELVVKPVAESGGYGLVVGPVATDEELAGLRTTIEADPRNWIAQEVVGLSRHPTQIDHLLGPRHIDLRPFVVTGEHTKVLPGGLTRVALREGSLVVNSSQGGGSKDTWIVEVD